MKRRDRGKGSDAQSAGGLIGTFVRLVFFDSAGNILGTTPWGFRPEPLFQHQNAGGLSGSFGAGAGAPASSEAAQAAFLRRAVVKALGQACRCKVEPRNFVALNPNFVRVVNPARLPLNIFKGSLSSHARSYSADIPNSVYDLKYYSGDNDNGGLSTITITTSLSDIRHYIDFVFSYSMGDPINSYYARQYCLGAGGC